MSPKTSFQHQQDIRDMNLPQKMQGNVNADYQDSGASLEELGAAAGGGGQATYLPMPLIALSAIGLFIYLKR